MKRREFVRLLGSTANAPENGPPIPAKDRGMRRMVAINAPPARVCDETRRSN